MTRIVKKPEERRAELIGTALELFQSQGYIGTSVEAIIRKTGVAKGTFYHYFKSKEEILEAVVRTILDRVIEEANEFAEVPTLSAVEKLKVLLGGQSRGGQEAQEMAETLNMAENRELHAKINVDTVLRLSPILAKVVEQGIQEGVFKVEHVLETLQFLVTGSQFLFDLGSFQWSGDQLLTRVKAMQVIIERALGAEPGTFRFLSDKYEREG